MRADPPLLPIYFSLDPPSVPPKFNPLLHTVPQDPPSHYHTPTPGPELNMSQSPLSQGIPAVYVRPVARVRYSPYPPASASRHFAAGNPRSLPVQPPLYPLHPALVSHALARDLERVIERDQHCRRASTRPPPSNSMTWQEPQAHHATVRIFLIAFLLSAPNQESSLRTDISSNLPTSTNIRLTTP